MIVRRYNCLVDDAKFVSVGIGVDSSAHYALLDHFSLDELQALVGGYIETVIVPPGLNVPGAPRVVERIFLVNEEGRCLHLAKNRLVSALCGKPIYGPVGLVQRERD